MREFEQSGAVKSFGSLHSPADSVGQTRDYTEEGCRLALVVVAGCDPTRRISYSDSRDAKLIHRVGGQIIRAVSAADLRRSGVQDRRPDRAGYAGVFPIAGH